MRIKDVRAFQIIDSRGNPTIRTLIKLDDGVVGYANVPAGASTGRHEAVELRDREENLFHGMSVYKAVRNVNEIIGPELIGKIIDPKEIDEKLISLDGTPDKSRLGANALLSVSLAILRSVALSKRIPLWEFINRYYFSSVSPSFPRLVVNIVNGGKHADWRFDIQEFMVIPLSSSPSSAVRIADEIFIELGRLIKEKGGTTLVGNEGGYSPHLSSNQDVFELILMAAGRLGYENGKDFNLGIDAAASEFYGGGNYRFEKRLLNSNELSSYYKKMVNDYHLALLEDPFAEDDWNSFTKFTEDEGERVLVVGDDLYTTNEERIRKGVQEKATNASLIKPNQIGTVLETVRAIEAAREGGMKIVVSHRSGETCDSFIADFAYAAGAEFIKTGSMSRSERLAKYNRLLEVEEMTKIHWSV